MKRDKSIVQQDMSRCWFCGTTQNLHIHEIFFGSANREKSIKWGCYVSLCGKHHNQSKEGVHFDKNFNNCLKQVAQRKFEERYGHEKFMEVFNRNYL
jgi:hypothetical protein